LLGFIIVEVIPMDKHVKDGLREALTAIDVDFRVVDVGQLTIVESWLNEVAQSEEVNWGAVDIEQFKRHYLKVFQGKYNFAYQQVMDNAKRVLIMAIKVPVHQVGFMLDGQVTKVMIPSDYLNQSRVKLVEHHLDQWLVARGYSYQPAKLPLKMLAVGSGLAQYGRNNLVYVDQMGSRLFLIAYYIDAPLVCDLWSGLHRMSICDRCGNCVKHCPTQALSLDRRIVKAERCLALYNEDVLAIPQWIDQSAHNALIGCIRCEEMCPVNRQYDDQLSVLLTIDEKTTQEILSSKPLQEHTKDTYSLLEAYGMVKYYPVLKRNLALLINQTMTASD
jgi:epoxyqueuosine reductase